MPHNRSGACANTVDFALQGFIRINSDWDWSICIRKVLLPLALLIALLLGREDLEMILKQLLN